MKRGSVTEALKSFSCEIKYKGEKTKIIKSLWDLPEQSGRNTIFCVVLYNRACHHNNTTMCFYNWGKFSPKEIRAQRAVESSCMNTGIKPPQKSKNDKKCTEVPTASVNCLSLTDGIWFREQWVSALSRRQFYRFYSISEFYSDAEDYTGEINLLCAPSAELEGFMVIGKDEGFH